MVTIYCRIKQINCSIVYYKNTTGTSLSKKQTALKNGWKHDNGTNNDWLDDIVHK